MSLLEITSISASWERRTWLDASIWLLAMALVAKKLLSSSKYRKPGESIGAGDPSLMAARVEQETSFECRELLKMMGGHTRTSQVLKQGVYHSAWNPSLALGAMI